MTDRVEINPDNTNKPLEQSQEDLAKQGINVNESQVNANGESINISEPDNKVQSKPPYSRDYSSDIYQIFLYNPPNQYFQ